MVATAATAKYAGVRRSPSGALMSKSQRLRTVDVRNVHRLINDCRDLGADPIAWRRRLIEGLNQLTGAGVGYLVSLVGFPAPGVGAAEMVQVGLEGREQTKLFGEHFQYMAGGGTDPMLSHFATLPQDVLNTCQVEDAVDQKVWRRSESFQRFHRRMDMDTGILSMAPLRRRSGTIHHTVSLRRGLGERPFSNARDVRLVHYLHEELAPLIGRRLATAGQPSASELSPRLRETLQGLLEGLSEKQIADRCGISRATLHEYVTKLYRRFGVNSRHELMARWIRYGTGTAANGDANPRGDASI